MNDRLRKAAVEAGQAARMALIRIEISNRRKATESDIRAIARQAARAFRTAIRLETGRSPDRDRDRQAVRSMAAEAYFHAFRPDLDGK